MDGAAAWLIACDASGAPAGDAEAPETIGPTAPATGEACALVSGRLPATPWAPLASIPACNRPASTDAAADDATGPGWTGGDPASVGCFLTGDVRWPPGCAEPSRRGIPADRGAAV